MELDFFYFKRLYFNVAPKLTRFTTPTVPLQNDRLCSNGNKHRKTGTIMQETARFTSGLKNRILSQDLKQFLKSCKVYIFFQGHVTITSSFMIL